MYEKAPYIRSESAREIPVPVGEIGVASREGELIVALGLGSCIGAVVFDEHAGIVAVAHVFLPERTDSTRRQGGAGTFAPTAIPALVDRVRALGARPSRLRGLMVGGSKMFAATKGPAGSIGDRNAEAVRHAFRMARIPIVAEDIGGSIGRSLHVHGGTCEMFVKRTGSQFEAIWSPKRIGQIAA